LKHKSKLDLSDEDLFLYFFNRLAGETKCKNRDCDCLLILADEFARKAIACYLVLFEHKTKYEQDSTVLEWYRYTTSAERGGNNCCPKKGRTNYYHLPYDGNFINDNDSLQVLQNHRLCTEGMKAVMSLGYDRMKSIQTAAKTTGVMPRHASNEAKGHSTKNNLQLLDSLNGHFNYLLQLGEVRATRAVATLVDGAGGHDNGEVEDDEVYLLISMGYPNCYRRYMALLGYKVTYTPNGSIMIEGEGGNAVNNDEFVSFASYFPSGKKTTPS
jgi:hypothetical protein